MVAAAALGADYPANRKHRRLCQPQQSDNATAVVLAVVVVVVEVVVVVIRGVADPNLLAGTREINAGDFNAAFEDALPPLPLMPRWFVEL